MMQDHTTIGNAGGSLRAISEVRDYNPNIIKGNSSIYENAPLGSNFPKNTIGKRALSTMSKSGNYTVQPTEKLSLPEIALYNKDHNQKFPKMIGLRRQLMKRKGQVKP